jgi:hypothetical protein
MTRVWLFLMHTFCWCTKNSVKSNSCPRENCNKRNLTHFLRCQYVATIGYRVFLDNAAAGGILLNEPQTLLLFQ